MNIKSNVIVPLPMVFAEMPEKDEGTQAIWKSTFDNDYKELEEIGRLVPKNVKWKTDAMLLNTMYFFLIRMTFNVQGEICSCEEMSTEVF